MTLLRRLTPLILYGACLAGCTTLPPLQDTISKFDEGAHSVAAAQMDFIRAVRTVDCESQFFTRAYNYAKGTGGIDLRNSCTPTVIKDQELQIRQTFLNAVTLYADQLQALAAAGDDKTLDDNSQSLATATNSFAKKQGFSKLGVASDVEAAIIGLTNMVMDHKKSDIIKVAAANQQDNLAKVVSYLKDENASFAGSIESNLGLMRADLATISADVRKKDGDAVFFYLLQTPGILRGADPFAQSTSPAGTSDLASLAATSNPDSNAEVLNKSLDSLVQANQALAKSAAPGIVAAVNDLVTRAKAAQGIQRTLDK